MVSLLPHSIFKNATLNRYFAWVLLKSIFYLLLFCTVLIILIDFTEQLRRTSGRIEVSALSILGFAMLRTPAILEKVFPFAVLFASMITFFFLSKRLELVVARSSGISAWQFLLPSFVVALFVGIFATVAFNPLTNYFEGKALQLESHIFKRDAKLLTDVHTAVWLRKTTRSEDILLGAARATHDGRELIGVTIIRQNRQGKLIQRVDADSATLNDTQWMLTNATITNLTTQKRALDNYALKLDLSIEEVREGFSESQQRSFWSLPELIEKARNADLPTFRYSLQFNTLLAQPFFFIAMVVIAATVSLRFIRSGNVNGLIASGIAAGFVLFILRELAEDLGNSGVVQPILAAWLPPLLALVLGFTVLLHQEDG